VTVDELFTALLTNPWFYRDLGCEYVAGLTPAFVKAKPITGVVLDVLVCWAVYNFHATIVASGRRYIQARLE
jgi:hypothetical protein